MLFTDKVVLVTGAGDGIGKATAILFAKKGAKVVINDFNPVKGNNTLEAIKSEGGKAIFVQGDISKIDDTKKAVEETIKAFGRIDVLVNNAGIVFAGRVDNTSEEDFDKTMAVNVKGLYFISKYSIIEMKKQGGGVIVNISSVAAVKGIKDRASYSASKGAVLSLTKAMAIDYMQDNIRINCICPGTICTPSLEARIQATKDPEKTRLEWISRQPIGRLGKPEEIAFAVLFAASEEVSFMDGSVLYVDGGEAL